MATHTERTVTEPSVDSPASTEPRTIEDRFEALSERLRPGSLSTLSAVLLAGIATAVIFFVMSVLPEPDPAAVAAAPMWPSLVFELSIITAGIGLLTRSHIGRLGVIGIGAILAYLSIDCLLAGHTGIDLTMGAVGGVGLVGLAALIRR